MKKAAYFLLVTLGIPVFTACKQPTTGQVNETPSVSVETKAPNTN